MRAWPRLRYQELWPGIDLVLKESPSGQLEYDLLLAAGADPARARLRYQGASALTLDPATGRLQAATTAGPLTEYRPQAWQTDPTTGQPRPVACDFVLSGTTVGFKLGKYNHKLPLVIDPVVQFASYTGSAVENWGFAATHDAAGNLYTAGVVFEPGYPVTTGAYQTIFSGNIDVAVMKFNTGTTGPGARAWATYLGGSQLEFPHSLLVNGRGELLGSTSSADYPTTAGALSRVLKGGPSISPFGGNSPFVMTAGADLVLSRLSASGGKLRASTYLGGTSTDGLLDAAAPTPRLRHNYGDGFRGDLALDPQGNVYVASVTTSPDFPGLAGATYRGGPSDALVTSLDSSFSQVRWATLLGGTGADAAYSLQREDTGGLLVAGGTTSPVLAGATGGYLAVPGGGVDGFVARLSAGGVLAQATYLGTGSYDQAFFVRSSPGGLLVLGQTLSQTWPGADTARYHTAHGQHFIQQLAPDLRSAGYATVFGSGRATTDLSPTAFGVDCYGRIGVAGWGGGLDPNGGNTTGLATTPNALQRTTDGQDFYLMQLSDGARVLDYATYFGTSADDHLDGASSRFDANLTLFQALCACDQAGGQSIPLPPGATTYAPHNGAPHCNNAAFKFALTAGTSPAGADTLSLCAQAQRVRLSGSPACGVWSGPGVTGSLAGGYYFNPSQLLVGVQVLTYTSPPAANGCAGVSTRRITVLSQPAATLTAPQTAFCLDAGVPLASVPLTATPAGGTFHGTGVVVSATGTATFNPTLAGVGGHFLSYEVSGGRCPVQALLTMNVQKVQHVEASPPAEICLNDPPALLTGSPTGGIWSGPGVSLSGGVYIFSPQAVGAGGPYLLIYSMPTTPPACPIGSDTLLMTVLPAGTIATVPADTTFCLRNQVVRLRGGLPASGTWAGPGVTGSLTQSFFFTAAANLVGVQLLTYTGPPGATPRCPGRAQRKFTVTSSGQATVSAGTLAVCAVSGPQVLQATPGGGTWTGPGVSGSVAQGFVFTPSVALVGMQTLNYLGAQPANPALCPVAGSLQVLAVPTVTFDPIAPISFCLAAPPHGTALMASPAGGTFSGPGVVANRFDPSAVGPGHYVLSYTWNYPNVNCPIVATQTVDVLLLPPPHVAADTVLCTGSRVPFQLKATPAGGTWAGPGVTATGLFTPSATPGTATLAYTLPAGCGTATYRITVPAQPTSAVVRWTVPACPANDRAPRHLRFEATGASAALVQWDFGDGSAPATGAVVEHTYAAAGHYQPSATLTGPVGLCDNQFTLLAAVEVRLAQVPDIITPNGDGLNDKFAPRLGGCPGRLRVFSRWGTKVFEVAEYHNDWAATELPSGLYYYILDGADATAQVKGWVEVVR
ncbi:MAG: gliding motility-associated C-terminal domain-containing protein [Janthinobacterium lividum]